MEGYLSESQRMAAEQIRGLLRQPNRGKAPPLVGIVGLSGVGKDALWSAVQKEFPHAKFVGCSSIPEISPKTNRKYVTTVIPAETVELTWPGDINFVTVKGMTEEETRKYVGQRAGKNRDIEKIVRQSLGIPLLADMILPRELSDKDADLLVGTHLGISWGYIEERSRIMDYIQIRPSDIAWSIFQEYRYCRTPFGCMATVAEDHETLRHKGVELKSPFFQAGNSYSILEGEKMGDYGALPKVFAPNLCQKDYETIRKELLPEGETDNLRKSAWSEKSRWWVFRLKGRKVAIYLEPEKRASATVDIASGSVSPSEFLNRWKGGQLDGLQLPPHFSQGKRGKFFICAHDHLGYSNLQVAWMAESLLQNIGIPYVACYSEQVYLYNPKKRLMEPVPKK